MIRLEAKTSLENVLLCFIILLSAIMNVIHKQYSESAIEYQIID